MPRFHRPCPCFLRAVVPAAALLALLHVRELPAANRYSIEDRDLSLGSGGQTLLLYCDHDIDLYGFQLALKYEPAKIRVSALRLAAGADKPVWQSLRYDNARGEVIVGVVYVLLEGAEPGPDLDNFLAPAARRPLLELTVDVVAASPTTTFLDFRDGLQSGAVPIYNLILNSNADGVAPALEDRLLDIRSFAPEIVTVTPGSGRAGDRFFISVRNLDLPGITIGLEVCGQALAFSRPGGFYLTSDRKALDVTAPPCAVLGFVPITVTTDHGSHTLAAGFEYLPSLSPAIVAVEGNEGQAGKVFQVRGTNFGQPGLGVTVCGKPAQAVLRADGVTLDVTAPDCPAGWAALEVCTEEGCDAEPQGFRYVAAALPEIISISGNQGEPGKVFQVLGRNLGRPGLAVEVCGRVAQAVLRGDSQTLDVTAPDCDPGWALLQVCTTDGCDGEAQGFFYLPAERPFKRGDANDDRRIDIGDPITILADLFLGFPAAAPCRDALDIDDNGELEVTDPIKVLLYLFQAGPPPADPFREASTDPTPDDLPHCF